MLEEVWHPLGLVLAHIERVAPFAGAETGGEALFGGGEEEDVFGFWVAGGADGSAEDAGGFDGDKVEAIEAGFFSGEGVVELGVGGGLEHGRGEW